MAYDIHGNRLTEGHCEVHPHISEPYPCSVCRAQDTAERDAYDYQQDRYGELQDAYYRAQEEHAEDDLLEAERRKQNGGRS